MFDPETGVAEVSGDSEPATDQGEVGCGQAASRLSPDLFYGFSLDGTADVRVEVRPQGGFEPAIALRSGGCRGGVELVCSTAAPHALAADGLLAGDYLILIDGARPGAAGSFDLTVEIAPR